MAKIPPYCDYANEISGLLLEGRRPEAAEKAAAYLRQGVASPLFLKLVAEQWVQPKSKPVGGPKRPPKHWLEIAKEFEDLRDAGMTVEVARENLAEKYDCAERTIDRAVRVYQEAR